MHPGGQKANSSSHVLCSVPPAQQGADQWVNIGILLLFKKIIEEKQPPQLRKMADVEMDIASTRMNNGNEHV